MKVEEFDFQLIYQNKLIIIRKQKQKQIEGYNKIINLMHQNNYAFLHEYQKSNM